MTDRPASLKAVALRHLARREHSRAELRRKLIAHLRRPARAPRARPVNAGACGPADTSPAGHDETDGADHDPDRRESVSDDEDALQAAVDQVLDDLAARGWLSEARAAESLVAARAPRFGVRRLAQLLDQRGIDREVAAAQLGAVRDSEFERARDLWRRRFGVAPGDAAERARQIRFLLARGVDAGVARRVVGDDD